MQGDELGNGPRAVGSVESADLFGVEEVTEIGLHNEGRGGPGLEFAQGLVEDAQAGEAGILE